MPSFSLTETCIGEGSSGKILVAIENSTGLKAAAKVFSKAGTLSSAKSREAAKEARILQSLNHVNIVKLLHFSEDEKTVKLFTELLDKDVFTYVRGQAAKGLRMNEETAFGLFQQMVSAVQYLHSKNISHHDIKLENFVLHAEGQLKLIDFGYAIETSAGQLIRNWNGSPCYSAPELLFRRPHTENIDVYSLGVCLYYMLSLQFPFCNEEDDLNELLLNVKAFDLQMPVGISADAKDLICKMITKTGTNRIHINDILNHPWCKWHKVCNQLECNQQ